MHQPLKKKNETSTSPEAPVVPLASSTSVQEPNSTQVTSNTVAAETLPKQIFQPESKGASSSSDDLEKTEPSEALAFEKIAAEPPLIEEPKEISLVDEKSVASPAEPSTSDAPTETPVQNHDAQEASNEHTAELMPPALAPVQDHIAQSIEPQTEGESVDLIAEDQSAYGGAQEQNATSPEPIMQAAPQAVIPTPSQATKTRKIKGSISIIDLEDDENEEDGESEEEEVVAGDAITESTLIKAWKAYAEIIKAQRKFSFHSTLNNRTPTILDANTIHITLENEVQMEDLNIEKADLMAYMREEVNNPALSLESEIKEDPDDVNISLQTPREQFKHMIKKNPNLGEMTKRFDLDVDY